MTFIKQITVKPSEAKELEHLGFILKLVALHLNGEDTYKVFAKYPLTNGICTVTLS